MLLHEIGGITTTTTYVLEATAWNKAALQPPLSYVLETLLLRDATYSLSWSSTL